MPTPTFQLEHVSKAFTGPDGATFTALHDVSLDVAEGSFVALLGPSGCGKSTLLHLLAGLTSPSAGRIRFQGDELDGVNTDAGYMTQKDTLLPWASLQDNVGMALAVRRIGDRRTRAEAVQAAIDAVGLTGFERHYPAQLSGGMRKRAQLARSLVYEPAVLLMDEPFAAVDAQRRVALQEHLLTIWQKLRKTVVLVTHDLDEAILLADQIVVMGTHPGRIVCRIKVPLARPRDVVELRSSPQFGDTWRELWNLLSAEMAAT
jgi:NitT/TauT family transport system ATP-binding protein